VLSGILEILSPNATLLQLTHQEMKDPPPVLLPHVVQMQIAESRMEPEHAYACLIILEIHMRDADQNVLSILIANLTELAFETHVKTHVRELAQPQPIAKS
jgi:hypothetical protein